MNEKCPGGDYPTGSTSGGTIGGNSGTSGTSTSGGNTWTGSNSGGTSGNSWTGGNSGTSGTGMPGGGGSGTWTGGNSGTSGGSTSGLSTVTGTGAGNSWFNWVSTSTSNEGASTASGVTCGCGNLVKDECFFPDKSSCNHFYHCHNITAYHKRCPSNLYWNDATKRCDWPRNVVCNVPSGNSNSMSGNNAMGGGSGMMHMGRMIHSESEMNSDVPRSTASSSAATSGCEGDDCPEVTSDGLGGIFLNVHPTFECKKGINEKMKDPESCSRFIQCMDGFAYHFACQENLQWNSEMKVCIDKSMSNCESADKNPNAAPTNPNGDKENSQLCPSGFKGLLPDDSDCRRYISCSENGGFYMKCQTGLVWNKTTKTCDWPSEENPGC